jgi:NADPH-dependent 7-cyano-7-deazaguanine reductase QueF
MARCRSGTINKSISTPYQQYQTTYQSNNRKDQGSLSPEQKKNRFTYQINTKRDRGIVTSPALTAACPETNQSVLQTMTLTRD